MWTPLQWIEVHRVGQRRTRETRESYERTVRKVTDREWDRALRQAQQRERVRARIQAGRARTFIGTVLRGFLKFKDVVTIPVRVSGVDIAGVEFHSVVDVTVSRDQRISDLRKEAFRLFAERYPGRQWASQVPTIVAGAFAGRPDDETAQES